MTENVVHLHKDTNEPATVTTLTVVPEPAPAPPVPLWVRSGRAVKTAVTHDHTKATARAAARHSLYVVGGARIVGRRAWDGRTAARYERYMRTAEAAGNMELAAEWEERGQRYRDARHRRRMDLLTSPIDAAKGIAAGTGMGIGGLVALGIVMAIATKDVSDVVTPLMAAVDFINLLIWIVQVVWGPVITIGPFLALLALWAVGSKQHAAPAWALPANIKNGEGEPITPSIVIKALRDLGVAPLRNAIKDMGDAGASMLGPIRIAGCGVEVDVTLPSGVSTIEVQNRRRKLAENLTRHEHEVFIMIPIAARTVRLWIADSGALDEPIGPSPLVTDETMTADYTKGRAPWGQDLRGDAAALSLYQRHLLITGLSNQGKTAALRSLALWASLDRRVEFRIADLKGAGDWSMFDGLATILIQGPTDEHVIEATEMVEGLVDEMNQRIAQRQADPTVVFDPLIGIVDEAQVAFMCPAMDDQKRPYGGSKALSRYFMAVRKVHNQGRVVDVLMYEGTQDPTDQNLPKLVREGAHTRASLALGTAAQSVMALGEKAVNAGAAPHLLRQGLDKGTLVIASDGIEIPKGQSSITVRTHFIGDEDAKAITERAKALRDGVTTLNRGEKRDPLTDIASVLGDKPRVRTKDVLARLAALSADAYGGWSFIDLKRVLDDAGAEPHKSDGVMVVSRDRVLRSLANRDADGSASAEG
ncbi:FtsK/SpoIIIE domain-containing protein [Streptomyces sp. NBC_01571]|uniref:FtsK/SpoIIIE domain-containing protein n=1 Tax=Streptomyces sp. NBC_01571 TaxID=2975883 RepID=UPI0022572F38|nr:FtsK/SpoIIIE domain-containing protein [Streptomyces sp. NBC_01571]MCX4576083.1 FtsK/SpoIIIE domain-containing protein [Streptomyces sp. NBC_01571]